MGFSKGWVTKEQIERAKALPAIEYILKHEPQNVKRVGSDYRLRDHDSLNVSYKGWYWHSQGFGGWSALSYQTKVRNYDFVDAVCSILNEMPQSRHIKNNPADTKIKAQHNNSRIILQPLELPIRNPDNKRVLAYLQSRGIDRELIIAIINRGELYESRYYHNAVFLGKDENGKTRYAAIRSTTGNYMCDAKGSDKRYGFKLPPQEPNASDIAVYESPIDALSHQTLCKKGIIPIFTGWRLSLGGTSLYSLEHFISLNPDIRHCIINTDNDTVGELAASKIMTIPGITAERILPIAGGKDWNEALQTIQKTERKAFKPPSSEKPCI